MHRTGNQARSVYQHGRALMANGDFAAARREFEKAHAGGYRAAYVDLGRLLSQSTGELPELRRAISQYQQAWNAGVQIAAFALGNLYEHGVTRANASLLTPDKALAWSWYRRGAEAGEPNALARCAENADDAALRAENTAKRNAYLLEAMRYYASAAERARQEDWPDEAWRNWRYRRASLARLLSSEGMMHEVADVYEAVRTQYAPPRSTLWNRLTSLVRADGSD
jgi:TPR repeat protein